jgi:SAM-dependent methyltransferase
MIGMEMQRQRTQYSDLGRGFSYNRKVARWWLKRATDDAHKRAYKNIAAFIRASFAREPRLIVDYACGAGHLLAALSRRFPDSKLVGLDGSSFLLDLAERRFLRMPRDRAQRISLIETPLPNLSLLASRADLVVFCFPNMMPSSEEEERSGGAFELSKGDRWVAEKLSLADESSDEENEPLDPAAIQGTLERNRKISCNLRRLLIRGGICVRVEYATMQRHEWSPLELQRVCFEEGALDSEVEGKLCDQWFRVLASAYFRSRVMEDVYQQTGDKRDKKGGYLITVLRAI